MKRFTSRLSPATVIACIALFVSLGGVSYGVATGSIDSREIKNNTVRSKDIRNNDVRGKDIRTGAVGSSDIRNNGVRGTDILESSLGKVPSAGTADSANSANSANTANSAGSADSFGGMTARRVEPFTLTNGQSQTLASIGPFTLTASCAINEAGNDFARVRITTSQNNSALDGDDTEADFDTGDANELYAEVQSTTGTAGFDQESDGAAIAPDGTEILGNELYVGVNVLNQTGQCRYGGVIFVG